MEKRGFIGQWCLEGKERYTDPVTQSRALSRILSRGVLKCLNIACLGGGGVVKEEN